MTKPKHHTPRGVGAKAPMAHQERERRLALSKAYVLEPGPLIAARCYEQEPSDDVARACHRGIEHRSTLKRPLDERGEQCKSGPYKEIASSEPDSCTEWRGLRLGLSPHTGIHENHGHR